MDYTVYTMGDMSIFTSVLNAMTAVFNSSLFDPSQGAGVFVVAVLSGIILLSFNTVLTGRFNPLFLIMVFTLFFGGIVPRERLQVEDIYSGQVTAIDNVPEIIALPASLMATLTNAITSDVETAFTTTSGTSYLSLGAEGFAQPLRTLLKLHDPMLLSKSAQATYIQQSLREFVTYCAPTDPTYSVATAQNAADVVGYLTGLSVSGVTTYWNQANPQGVGVSCVQAQTNLKSDMTFSTGSPIEVALDTALAAPTDGNSSSNPNSQSKTIAGVSGAYSDVFGMLSGLAQTSQQYMANMFAYMPFNEGQGCSPEASTSNWYDCMNQVALRVTQEKQQTDEAAAGSIFAKTAIPAMNILLALFYGFSPIILAIALIAGPHALKMLAGFVMFGAWTQSWMPIAAVINYMIQLQVQYGFSTMPTSGVTLAIYNPFYTALAMKVGMASNLLAMTPMISFALLSGSVYGLTKVSQAMDSKAYHNDDLEVPDAAKNDALVSNASRRTHVGDTSYQTGTGLHTNATNNPSLDVEISSGLQTSTSKTLSQITSDLHSVAAGYQHAMKVNSSELDQHGFTHDAQQVVSDAVSKSATIAEEAASLVSHDENLSDSQKIKLAAGLQAGLRKLTSDGGASLETALMDVQKSSKSKKEAQSLTNDFTHSVKGQTSFQDAYSHINSFNSALEEGHTFASQDQHLSQATGSLSQVESASLSAKQGVHSNTREMASNAFSNGMSANQIFNNAFKYAGKNGINEQALAGRAAALENRIARLNNIPVGELGDADKMNAMLMALREEGGNVVEFGVQNDMFSGADSMYGSLTNQMAQTRDAELPSKIPADTMPHVTNTVSKNVAMPGDPHALAGASAILSGVGGGISHGNAMAGGVREALGTNKDLGDLAEHLLKTHPYEAALLGGSGVVAQALFGRKEGGALASKWGEKIAEWAKSNGTELRETLARNPELRAAVSRMGGFAGAGFTLADVAHKGHADTNDYVTGAADAMLMSRNPILEGLGGFALLAQAGANWVGNDFADHQLEQNQAESAEFGRTMGSIKDQELRHEILADLTKHGPEEYHRFNQFIADGGTAQDFMSARHTFSQRGRTDK